MDVRALLEVKPSVRFDKPGPLVLYTVCCQCEMPVC